jgi:membrane protease YdiL (CAAX protease family)
MDVDELRPEAPRGSDVSPPSGVFAAEAVRYSATRTLVRVGFAVLLGLLANSGAMILLSALTAVRPTLFSDHPWLIGPVNHTGMVAAALLIMLILTRGRLGSCGFCLPSRFSVAPLLMLSGGLSGLAYVLGLLLPEESFALLQGLTPLQQVALVWIYASVAEEVLTRGLVQSYLRPVADRGVRLGRLRLSLPVLVSASFFGAMHLMLLTLAVPLAGVLLIVAFATAVGLVAAYYRERTGSLLPAMLAHAFANATGSVLDWIL